MKLKQNILHQAENDFESFLAKLRAQEAAEWAWLMGYLEGLIIPWLFKKVTSLPKNYNMSKDAFIEEVFSNTTYKFYDIFKTGTFSSLAELRGLAFKIAELKIKEGYRKVKRDAKIYFNDEDASTFDGNMFKITTAERRRKETLEEIKEHIYTLPRVEQTILIEYLKGESFKEISETIGLTAANCRKKKQRALDKVKAMFFNALSISILLYLSLA